MIRRCPKCQRETRHEVTTNDRPIILDADTDPLGEFVLELPEDGPAIARWIAAYPKRLREDAHRTQGLYRRHQETCDPLTLEGVA